MIDLHTHSTASDGTEPPAAVMAQAVAAGLQVVALTDHDTTRGWDEASAAARRLGITLVPGIEVSCSRGRQSIHLLAYLPDPADPALSSELRRARESRETRLDRMVELMAADGIPLTVAQVRAQVEPGATPGRPHIADALVEAGIVGHRDEAFARWSSSNSRYYVEHYAPDPVEAVALVRGAGGVAVIAHPHSGLRRRQVSDALIEEMADAGLAGLEVRHRDHDAAAIGRLLELAASLDLFVTGSSDYHGEGKLNRLGENVTTAEVLEGIEARARGAHVVRP
jgi:predicted metal-dependent phosphoesterase TrpH